MSFAMIMVLVILLVLLAISLVLITERSLVSFVKRGGVKAARYAKEDMDRRKEVWAERQAEKKRLREERIVRGVALDSTKLEEEDSEEEEDLAGLTEAIARGAGKPAEAPGSRRGAVGRRGGAVAGLPALGAPGA